MHIKDHPDNSRDFILNGMRDAKMRETVLAEFRKIQGSKIGELSANFDIVMGYTAGELEDGSLQGGIGKPEGLPALKTAAG